MREEHRQGRDFGTKLGIHWYLHGREIYALIQRDGLKRPDRGFAGQPPDPDGDEPAEPGEGGAIPA
jgi:hypothetical protein